MRIALQKPYAAVEFAKIGLTAARSFDAPAENSEIICGTLSVVSVPIGDFDDVTVRALRVLRDADLIIAEDARVVRRLLRWHSIMAPDIVSLRPRRGKAAQSDLHYALADGRNVALVCDAGTPGIADAGQEFISAALNLGAAVSAVPGPCAALAALTVSGFPAQHFSFRGFPPRDACARAAFFHEIACGTGTTILYEKSPALFAALTELCRVCGASRPAVLACELTKPTEQIQRGSLEELRRCCKADQPKGEIILVLGPLSKQTNR